MIDDATTGPPEDSKLADEVDGVIVQDSRVDRGQISGAPEDGESIFPIVE